MSEASFKEDCVEYENECEINKMSDVEASVTRFVCAIENDADLELLGTDTVDDKEVFIVKNPLVASDVEGHCVLVDVQEVIDLATTKKRAQGFVDVAKGSQNDIPCKSYSRIVGYYSATHNWNNSKLSELRDRARGSYGAPHFASENQDEREKNINTMRRAYGN
jgi:hypothetical protein